MNRRTAEAELERFVTSRLVTALDALPVPPEGGRRSAPARRWSDPVVAFALLFVLAATVVTWPPVSQAVADAAKLLQQLVTGGSFVGYYFDLRPPDADPHAGQRASFASGTLPGAPTTPTVAGENYQLGISGPSGGADGSWTADGEHLLLWAGQRIYTGDRAGHVQLIADLGPRRIVVRAGWLRTGEVLAVLAPTGDASGRERWLVRIPVNGDHGPEQLLAASVIVWGSPAGSPDGRWLTVDVGRGTCTRSGFGASGAYDIERGVIVDLVDGAGRPLVALGWARDGRLVTAYCDGQRGAMDLFVAAPNSVPTAPFATVPWVRGSPQPFVDALRDRVILAPGGGVRPSSLIALTFDGRQTTLAELPSFASERGQRGPLLQIVYLRNMSRDGRYLAFSITDANDRRRTGVIELATGRVSYACPEERECYGMTVR